MRKTFQNPNMLLTWSLSRLSTWLNTKQEKALSATPFFLTANPSDLEKEEHGSWWLNRHSKEPSKHIKQVLNAVFNTTNPDLSFAYDC